MILLKWKLFQYQSWSERKAIDDWRKDLPVGLPRADLDNFLKMVAKKDKWEWPDFRWLTGKKYQGLGELRWTSGNVPHRIIGYFRADHEYVMLLGCTHNKKKYSPPDALETAVRRQEQIHYKEATSCEYTLLTD